MASPVRVGCMIRDIQFKAEFKRLVEQEYLADLDGLMIVDDYFEEMPLWSRIDRIDFLGSLPVAEKNRTLIRAAVWYLEIILEHARQYYAGREFDFYGMVSVFDEQEFEDGEILPISFWLSNPSRGVYDQLESSPPRSGFARFVAECLDHDPDYQLNETYASYLPGVDRVLIQRADMTGTPDRAGPPRKA
ncbi:hypothetical protein HUO13_07205 [Saccharopolyspora erythraea]|uniref:Imm15 family immunity protein n=1 Tax=Saccharopolyspora erythraea TaxID=1836 RepID=UPI001BAD22BC|nr:Imm15 family immunity protein [Saccharopolyspora erythraea]QUH00632.1 hypothetical protein HUO13_07205 [Saccharopolyspora erythraea]